MSVVVRLNDGTDYKLGDEEGKQVGYNVLPGGGIAIVVKPNGDTLWVQREFSPSGYQWVEGTRWGGELSKQAGADGKIEFTGRPRASIVV
ncbi:hypothetical protein [Glutamicibacter sp. NPDC127525]|uniref:hypothetical protein n=1 Tax=unclassified Glutamicibacter TaxID=2627139 RepID=UPI00363BE03F